MQTNKYSRIENLTILCAPNSEGERYAKDTHFSYRLASRLSGDNRYATAAAISQESYDKSDTVVLAYGMNYADALAGSLDKNNANKIMCILKQLNDEGKTVIMVTHDEELKEQGKTLIEL